MSQGPEGKGKDIWSRLGQTLRTGAETIVQETKELTKLSRLKIELVGLENERDRKYEDIGRAAHTLYKAGGAFPSELADLFAAADNVERRIEEKRKEIESLRAEEAREKEVARPTQEKLFCPQCGTQADPGDLFCRKCGARLQA